MTTQLNRTDAWFLAALTDSRKAKPMQLWEFVNKADWLNRDVPTYDDVRFSLPRLVAATYVEIRRDPRGRLTLTPTASALQLSSQVHAATLGAALVAFAVLVGARLYPEPEDEDRSLGPLEGFEQREWDTAVTKNADWMTSAVRRLLPGIRGPETPRDIH